MMHHIGRALCCKKQFLPLVNLRKLSSETDSSETDSSDPRNWRKPWNQRNKEWKSSFTWFAADRKSNSPDVIKFLQSNIDLRPSAIRKWYKRFSREAAIYDQRYIPRRHELLGSELAAAHFLVHRGALVKFEGSEEWIKRVDDEYKLPKLYDPSYVIEAIDATGLVLFYEGLANMTNLKRLRWLNLSNSPEIDDWSLDKISGEYRHCLEHLDISNCTQVTERGIAALYRMKKLKTLVVHNLAGSDVFQLTCLMLEDLHPELKIEGVKYISLSEAKQQAISS